MSGMGNSDFRRSIHTETMKSKGGSRGGFFDQMVIPKETYTPVLMVKGSFLDPAPQDWEKSLIDPRNGQLIPPLRSFFKAREHVRAINGGKRPNGKTIYAWCRAGWDPHNQKPCAGHMAEASGLKDIKLKDSFLQEVVHLALYHRVPAVSYQTGQLLDNHNKPGEHVMELKECEGRTCNYCMVKAGHAPMLEPGQTWVIPPQLITETFGARRFINLGKNHLGDLGGIDDTVSHRCAVDGMVMETEGWACPFCDSMLIELAQDRRPLKALQELTRKPIMCNTCRTPVLAEEVPSCRMCEGAGRVAEFKFNIFNQVLFLQREGEGTASKLSLKQFMGLDQFAQYSASFQPYFEGKTLEEIVAIHSRPYDFDRTLRIAGLSPEEEEKALATQAKRLDVESILARYRPTGSYGAPAQAPGSYGLPPTAQPWANQPAGTPPFAPPPGNPAQGPAFSAYPPGPAQTGPGPAPFPVPPKPNYSNN